MAYFSNGSEADYYVAKYCSRCIHGEGKKSCPVFALHWEWNYEAVGDKADPIKQHVLETLWPRDGVHNGDCAMFIERKEIAELKGKTSERL